MASPAPENRDDGSPPAKRRKLNERKPRTTQYLDLNSEELSTQDREQVDRVVKALHKKRKIVVIAGAGISVAAGGKHS